mgnify:CR=1 FL=1
MANFAALATKQNELIRKALDASMFVAPFSADAIVDLTGSDSTLAALPTGYVDGGLMTDEGIRFGREVESSDITSMGRVEPTRSDVESDVGTMQVDFQELNVTTIGLYTGADMSTITPDPVTGEIQIPKPARPTVRYYRLLALAVDEIEEGEIYVAKFFPRARITSWAEQAWQKGDTAIQWGMTFQAYVDEALGYSEMPIFGGPGWQAQLAAMGFDAS